MFDPIEAIDTIEGVAVVLYDWWLVASSTETGPSRKADNSAFTLS